MTKHLLTIIALALALAASPFNAAYAHETTKGSHGGAVVEAAGHHVEFVPSAGDVTFYLSGDKDEPIASTGANMKATVLDAGKTNQIELVAAEPNKLAGKLAAALTKGAKVVISGTLSDGHSLQARFVVP